MWIYHINSDKVSEAGTQLMNTETDIRESLTLEKILHIINVML